MRKTQKARTVIDFQTLKTLIPERVDKLPSPAEFRGIVGRGKNAKEMRVRYRWVGIGWVEEGDADGREPLLVIDDTIKLTDEENKTLKRFKE